MSETVRKRRSRSIALLLTGVVVGAILSAPAGAKLSKLAIPNISAYCSILAEPLVSYGPCTATGESIYTVDDPGNDVGSNTSIAIGTDGNPVISYRDYTANTLKVAKCKDLSCKGKRTITTVDDTTSDVGMYTSIAIGMDGNPVISYRDNTGEALRVAKCNDPACAGVNETITTVDDSGDVGLFPSIAIGTDGNPVIGYYDATAGALKVAKCNDPACVGANETLTTVDDPGDVGRSPSIKIGSGGNPVIGYYDGASALKVVKCNDAACAGADETITTVDPVNVGDFSISIAVGTDGNPVISYNDDTAGNLKVAKCNDPACAGTNETITTVDNSANNLGSRTSIAIGTDGNPVISYGDDPSDALMVAKCNDAACAGANETIMTVDNSFGDTSIAIGTDGNPVISYSGYTANSLMVARVSH